MVQFIHRLKDGVSGWVINAEVVEIIHGEVLDVLRRVVPVEDEDGGEVLHVDGGEEVGHAPGLGPGPGAELRAEGARVAAQRALQLHVHELEAALPAPAPPPPQPAHAGACNLDGGALPVVSNTYYCAI